MNIQYLKPDSKKAFKKLVGINRETSPSHVTKLKNSIDKIGMLQAIIVAELAFITGKKELYIIEGQHKYEACIALGIDIPYVVMKGIDDYRSLVETIALLNSSSKSWKLEDYVMAWSSVKQDYKTLMVLYNKYDIEINLAAAILSNVNSFFSGSSNILIRNGEFSIVAQDGEKLIAYAAEAIKQLPNLNRTVLRTFVSLYISTVKSLGKNYNHEIMLRYINKQKNNILIEQVDRHSISNFFDKYVDFVSSQKINQVA